MSTKLTWDTGAAVRELMEAMGVSKEDLADAMLVSRATVYNRLNSSRWSWIEATRAAQILGVEPAWLDRGEGKKFVSSTSADFERTPLVQLAINDTMAEFRRLLETHTERVIAVARRGVPAVHEP